MKLRIKISISILVVSLITLFTSCYYLINQNHMNNVSKEQERSLNDMDFLRDSLNNNLDLDNLSDDLLQLLLSDYDDFYSKRGIHLMLYHNSTPLYAEYSEIPAQKYSALLTINPGSKKVQILEEANEYYILVASTLGNDQYILVYSRNITEIYHERALSVKLSILLVIGLIVILSFLSYCFSRWITKPIDVLNHGATSISNGDYSIRIQTTKDEYRDLGVAFNQMAIDIENRTRELEDRAKELQVFIDDLSHEMNTPLTSIQGYSEFLLSANATEEQKQKAASIIRSEAKRMKDIYTKLLTLSFFREHELELVPINLKDLFEETKDIFLPLLQEKHLKLISNTSFKTLTADRTLIQILFSNLVKNSIQSLQENGSIYIKAYRENDSSILEVSDNGCGIPENKINDVIKPFFRVDKSRSRKTGGAGLGLSICKSIADLHHAELTINSTIDVGTTIKVIFYNSFTTS